MSRLLWRSKTPVSSPRAATYNIFIWDVGTDGGAPSEAAITSIAVMQYQSDTASDAVDHFTTDVQPHGVRGKSSRISLDDAWARFYDFIDNHSNGKPPLLVSHNSAFDVTVLLNQLRRIHLTIPSHWRFACSLLLAREIHSGARDYSQIALAARHGIKVLNPHNTSEDVIVLRNILKAFDKDAVFDDFPSHRVVPALCRAAKTPDFFDRSPQTRRTSTSSARNADTASQYAPVFITNTGSKYHAKGCRWLSRSCIERDTPPSGFLPCRVCLPNGTRPRVSSGSSTRAYSSARGASSSDRLDSAKIYVTNTGSKYHAEGCKWLSRSKILVESPPAGMRACGVCNPVYRKTETTAAPRSRVRDYSSGPDEDGDTDVEDDDVSDGDDDVSDGDDDEEVMFYTTRTGSKYHVRGCRSLRWSQIPTKKPAAGMKPCGICLKEDSRVQRPAMRRIHEESDDDVYA